MAHRTNNVFTKLRYSITENGRPVSMRRLSELLDGKVAHSHICDLEKGKFPSLSQLIAYHDFFNVSYDYLLGEITEVQHKDKDIFNTLEYLKESPKFKDQNIKKLLEEILSTNKGYALLFYLSEYFYNNDITEDALGKIIALIKNSSDNLEYSEIRFIIENYLNVERNE